MTSRKKQLEILDAFPVPSSPNECIGKIILSKGQSLFEALLPGKETPILVQLPPKFRGTVFVKRGNYVIIDMFQEATSKVSGDVKHILFPKQIKYIMKEGLWPDQFREEIVTQNEPDFPEYPDTFDDSLDDEEGDCDE